MENSKVRTNLYDGVIVRKGSGLDSWKKAYGMIEGNVVWQKKSALPSGEDIYKIGIQSYIGVSRADWLLQDRNAAGNKTVSTTITYYGKIAQELICKPLEKGAHIRALIKGFSVNCYEKDGKMNVTLETNGKGYPIAKDWGFMFAPGNGAEKLTDGFGAAIGIIVKSIFKKVKDGTLPVTTLTVASIVSDKTTEYIFGKNFIRDDHKVFIEIPFFGDFAEDIFEHYMIGDKVEIAFDKVVISESENNGKVYQHIKASGIPYPVTLSLGKNSSGNPAPEDSENDDGDFAGMHVIVDPDEVFIG